MNCKMWVICGSQITPESEDETFDSGLCPECYMMASDYGIDPDEIDEDFF